MNDRVILTKGNGQEIMSSHHSNVLNIYPLSSYYFGSKQATSYFKEETLPDRLHRFKINYDENGTRTCVQAIILVELFKHPHLLLLQVRNSIYKLPGGRVRRGELETECLQRKLSRKLSVDESSKLEWEVGECLGMWWRPNFQSVLYPYLPPNVERPKECTKLYLVKLPESRKFNVPKNFKLLAVPLCQVHENHKIYGPIISGVPQLLSKFSFNIINT